METFKLLEKYKQKVEVSDLVIEQLKKQLEKCAYQLISLQEKGLIKSIDDPVEDSSSEKDWRIKEWHPSQASNRLGGPMSGSNKQRELEEEDEEEEEMERTMSNSQ